MAQHLHAKYTQSLQVHQQWTVRVPAPCLKPAQKRSVNCSCVFKPSNYLPHSPCNLGIKNPRSYRAAQVQVNVFDGFKNMFSDSNSSNASSQDSEDEEDALGADLVRIDTDSTGGLGGTTEEAFGPLAVLLVGFMQTELDSFRVVMNDMDADIVKLIPCTKGMLGLTLLQAFETHFPRYEQPPLGQRRVMFLSGMYGSEVTEIISAYRDAGLPPCVFAGLVPNNAERTVEDLLDAVWRDHAAMMAKMQQQEDL